jgi:hypothetical protein
VSEESELKKQSQFTGMPKWHNIFIERHLWRFPPSEAAKKQSQFIP